MDDEPDDTISDSLRRLARGGAVGLAAYVIPEAKQLADALLLAVVVKQIDRGTLIRLRDWCNDRLARD